MKARLSLILLATAVHAWLAPASAESLTPQAFTFKGGDLTYVDRGEVHSAWNVSDKQAALKPGMKVFFFGRAESCDLSASDGPVTNVGSSRFEDARELTGLPLSRDVRQRWAPSANTERCEAAARAQVADSFVHVNPGPDGGVGMFTFTGVDRNGRRPFFQQFDRSGRGGRGHNPNIEGTFVVFRFDWQKGNTVRPWAGPERLASFRTVQSVTAVGLGDGAPRSREPVQAKQQFVIALINKACMAQLTERKGQCMFQYMFNTGLYRANVRDWSREEWFKHGGVFSDPAQGGMAVVNGPLVASGQSLRERRSSVDLYTSRGAPTQHGEFRNTEFRVDVSFAQLINTMRVTAGVHLRRDPQRVSESDLSRVFGNGWNDPNEWLLLSVQLGQEVHNPDQTARVYVGGNIREMEVRAR